VRIVIASTCVPYVRGGDRLLVRWTTEALRAAGHDVEAFSLPFPSLIELTLPALVGLRRMPFHDVCDRLITIRWPAHVLQHPHKTAWFIHHYRPLFDMWNTPYRDVRDNAEGRAYREHLRKVDNDGLREAKQVFTNSMVVRDRVREYNGMDAEVLYPPLGGDIGRFYTEEYGDFIVYPSRVTAIKRQLLAIEAIAATKTPVRLVILGASENRGYTAELRAAVRRHGLEGRVELMLGWVEEEVKVDLLARCLAVAYLPMDEDSYGYPSLEASHARKAIVALSDGGGVREFVRDRIEGRLVSPAAHDLAAAFDELYEDRALAAALGEASARRRTELNADWDHVVQRLVTT
jgi:glycosyltransferase involved in cell wall biosynthesis